MIATLSGTVAENLPEHLVLDVGGVGYGVQVSPEDSSHLSKGQAVTLYIYEHIRENAHDLFGFARPDTKKLFEQLLGVNGVGPKMALSILGIGTAEAVRAAIAAGDTKFIQAAAGVGKRVAERVIIELKDKVGLVSAAGATDFLQGPALQDEAVQALVALGFSPQDATLALQTVDPKLPSDQRVKQALKGHN